MSTFTTDARSSGPGYGRKKPRGQETPSQAVRRGEGPPHPDLLALGLPWTVPQLNRNVDQFVHTYRAQFGREPSPGLVLDLARAGFTGHDAHHLFQVPNDDAQAQAAATNERALQQQPFKYFLVNQRGFAVENNPVLDRVRKAVGEHPFVATHAQEIRMARTKFSTVDPGSLPLRSKQLDSLGTAVTAIPFLTQKLGAIVGTPNQAQLDALMGGVSNETLVLETAREKGISEAQAREVLAGRLRGNTQKLLRKSVQTVRDAQHELNMEYRRIDPSYKPLPETGVFNADWEHAQANYNASVGSWHRRALLQAQDAGFSNVHDYYNAIQHKRGLMKSLPLGEHFFAAFPLQFFTDSGISGFLQDGPKYTIGPLVEHPGFSEALHSLTRSASGVMYTFGGALDTAKAGLSVGPGLGEALLRKGFGSRESAIAAARRAFHQNPSWLRIIYPDIAKYEKPGGALDAVDGFSNLAVDFLVLRKPEFTGETIVGDGDAMLAKALSSKYVATTSRWALDYLKKGKLNRASAVLEGDIGSKRLLATVERGVRNGVEYSPEEMHNYVATLYARGRVEIGVGKGKTVTIQGPTLSSLRTKKLVTPLSTTVALRNRIRDVLDSATSAPEASALSSGAQNLMDGFKANLQVAEENAAGKAPLGPVKRAEAKLGRAQFMARHWRTQMEYERQVSPEHQVSNETLANLDYTSAEAVRAQEHLDAVRAEHGQSIRERLVGSGKTPLQDRLHPKPAEPPAEPAQAPQLRHGEQPVIARVKDLGKNAGRKLLLGVRKETQHAAPTGASRGLFDPELPQRVHTYVVKVLGDTDLANTLESRVVRAQAADNVSALSNLQRRLERHVHEKYPGEGAPDTDPFSAVLDTQAPARLHFPRPSRPVASADTWLEKVDNSVHNVNGWLNKSGQVLRRAIISGLGIALTTPLFWKHFVADPVRAIVGGGLKLGARGPEFEQADRELQAMIEADPAIRRMILNAKGRTVESETRWVLGGRLESKSFNTGDVLKPRLGGSRPLFKDQRYMTAAGASVRRMLDSDALDAYRASNAADTSPLVDLVLHNRTFNGLWKKWRARDKAAGRPPRTAEDYATDIGREFQSFEDGARVAGFEDPFDAAQRVRLASKPSATDSELGKWLAQHRIGFDVRKGEVEHGGTYDEITAWLTHKIMTGNKWTRGRFYDNVLKEQFASLRAAGFDKRTAAETAGAVAEKQTVYHMLDFANMVQGEQDLRWLSFFATKHRLYWKWVISTFARRPGYAALAYDASKMLDSNGNVPLGFSAPVIGKVGIPVTRLFWVPGADYSEVSPLGAAAGGALEAAAHFKDPASAAVQAFGRAGVNGNRFTRSDVASVMAYNWLTIQSGLRPAAYSTLLAHLPAKQAKYVEHQLNVVQADYYHAHGQFMPESDAVKYVAWRATAKEWWRSSMPLPAVEETGKEATDTEMNTWLSLINPTKKAKYLKQHPDLAAQFGIWGDPAKYVHVRDFFGRYVGVLNHWEAARQSLYDRARVSGMTPALEKERRTLDTAFSKARTRLLKDDAAATPADSVKHRKGEKLGWWGQIVERDKLVNPDKVYGHLFLNIPPKELKDNTVNARVKRAQEELAHLKDPEVAATYPDPQALDDRRNQLLDFLDKFRSFPHDKLGKADANYQETVVGPYWKHVKAQYDRIQKLPTSAQATAYAEFRAYRDRMEHSVEVNGIKFPGPAHMYWGSLPQNERADRVKKLVATDWAHLTAYEKKLLGAHVTPVVQTGWETLDLVSAAIKGDATARSVLAERGIRAPVAPPGWRAPKGWQASLATQVDRLVGARGQFEHDYRFSQLPRARRDLTLPAVRKDHNVTRLIALAAQVQATYARQGAPDSYVADVWRRYVVPEWLAQQPAHVKTDLALYGPDFVNTLIGYQAGG